MRTITAVANATMLGLGLTPDKVAWMLAGPNEDWVRLVRHMEAYGLDELAFIAGTRHDGSMPAEVRFTHGPHFTDVDGDQDAKLAAWVLLHRMNALYAGKFAGLDPRLTAEGTPAWNALMSLLEQVLRMVNVDTSNMPTLEDRIDALREALAVLQHAPGFAGVVEGVIEKLVAQSRAEQSSG